MIRRITAASLFALLLAVAHTSSAATFTFFQGGYGEGAFVSGTFTGTDLDENGQLSTFADIVGLGGGSFGEITNFTMSFSGNSTVAAFNVTFADLFGLVYDLDGGDLGDGQTLDLEGIGADNGNFGYFAGPGPFAVCDGVTECSGVFDNVLGTGDFSTQLVQISQVPIPAALPLLLSALAGLGFMRRRKSQ